MNQALKMPRSIRGLILFIFALVVLSGCSSVKNSMYEVAVSHENWHADLFKRTIEIDGSTISLLDSEGAGTKQTIVLIHGFAANKENWIRFAGHLTETYHVVAIDLPGHGESFKDLNLNYDFDDQAQYLRKILTRLNIDQCHMAGNSMGGAISCLYAASYPEEVQSLMLIDPAGVYQYECELSRMLEAGKNPLIVECEEDFDALIDLALEEKPFIPWPVTSVMAEKAINNKAINDKIFSDFHGDHQFVFEDELKKITAPTLIMWGVEDRIVHVNNSKVFEQLIPHSKMIVLEGVGHAPMIEVPGKSAKIYMDFISSL